MFIQRLTAAALLSTAISCPSLADITADQLWGEMQTWVAESGTSITARTSRQGGRLVLSNPTIDMGNGAVLSLPDITLRETPDRAVAVELPPRFSLTITTPPSREAPERVSITVSAPDLAILIRGLGDTTDFDISARSISASLDPLKMPPGSNMVADLFIALAVADLSLAYRHSLVDPDFSLDSTLSLGTFHGEFRADIPFENVKGSASLDLSALSGHLTAQAPFNAQEVLDRIDREAEPGLAELVALLDKGMKLDIGLTHGPLSFAIDTPTSPDGPLSMSVSAANGETVLTFDRSGFLYDTATGPSRFFIMAPQDPTFPLTEVEFSFTEYRNTWRLGFPIIGASGLNAGAASNAPDWGMLFRLTGLSTSSEVWDLADPTRAMPRDPISLVLDLNGKYVLDPQVVEPDYQPTAISPPVKTISVGLSELLISGLGLAVSGSGNVDLDLTQLSGPDNLPAANGQLSFVTTGANALLERLDRLGLLTKDDLTAARFALLFIGKATAGQDSLKTDLGFTGHSFSLNGQKIR